MFFLGQAEGKDMAFVKQSLRFGLRYLVFAHPDRADAQHRDLVGVPVGESIEAQNLGKTTNAPGVPDCIFAFLAVLGGRHHGGENAFFLDEVEEILVPDRAVEIRLEFGQAGFLEEGDRLLHDVARALIGIVANQMAWIEQHEKYLGWVERPLASFLTIRRPPGRKIRVASLVWPSLR